MNHELGVIREEYIESKAVSRSFWRNFAGNVKAGFGLTGSETPDAKMRRLGAQYTATRNQEIIHETLHEIHGDKAQIGTALSEKLIEEAKVLSEEELEFNRTTSQWYEPYAKFYRHPKFRAGIGIGLSVGAGFAAGSGLIPVSATLFLARQALGTIGLEGTMHAVQDHISYHNLKGEKNRIHAFRMTRQGRPFRDQKERTAYLGDMARSIGFLSEDRLRKDKDLSTHPVEHHGDHADHHAQPEAHGAHGGHGAHHQPKSTEEHLLETYEKKMAELIKAKLSNDPPTYAETLRAVLTEYDYIPRYQENALISDRKASAIRWSTAILASTVLTSFLTPDKFGPQPSLQATGARPAWWSYKPWLNWGVCLP